MNSEKLQLDGDARHQGEQDAGGDDANRGLDGSALGQPKFRQQRSQVADVLGGVRLGFAPGGTLRAHDFDDGPEASIMLIAMQRVLR